MNLLNLGFEVSQPESRDKKYFVGKAVIEVEVKENIDWFDIHAKIRFGEFEIPFKDLLKAHPETQSRIQVTEWRDRHYSGSMAFKICRPVRIE